MSGRILLQLFLFFCVLSVAVPQNALAHPHVFVESLIDIEAKDGRIVALRETWSFDEMSSVLFLGDLDLNQDGKLSEDEWNSLKGDISSYLHEEGFYTHIHVAGQTYGAAKVNDFVATFKDGMLRYTFTIPLNLPVPEGETVKIAIYDPTYYTAFFFEKEHVSVNGEKSDAVSMNEAPELAYYYGQIVPYAIHLGM
ncbi:DUF1007 family protein [Oleidesulfovibrio sp.]|uniref:DUF1007 family protein n=1 Tax=Oleidesulfovibrio sp. TaxID=2909707 RepID=UPI003A83D350